MDYRIPITALATAALLFGAAPGGAQEPSGDPDPAQANAALEACASAAAKAAECRPGEGCRQARADSEAAAAAEAAETAFRSWIEASPADPEPRVGLARTLTQCRIPFAPFMEQGVLVGRSNALLEEALELDPGHWGARFTLALNHYHTPEFLGRTKDAIRHFEILLEQQGERTDFPGMAAPYAYLGDLYLRTDRKEPAVELWRKGFALFPESDALKKRLAAAGADGPAGTAESAAQAETEPGEPAELTEPADGDTVTMDAIVVRVDAGYAMDDARGGQATLSKIDVYSAPGGTADIMQVFQMLPGATRAGEGSDLYVRGGDPAESPVLVDGARLHYPGVFETLAGSVFGLLDPAVLRRAYFSSGGFSVRYGDALSGVVSLETDGRPRVPSWRTGWNFAGAGATLRRPFGSRAGGWASLRATETSVLLALHGDSEEYPRLPRSIEGVAGAAWEPRPGVELEALVLGQADRTSREVDAVGYRGPFSSDGRTTLARVGARILSADAARSARGTLYVSERTSRFAFGVLDRERRDRSIGARFETELSSDPSRALRLGTEARRLAGRSHGRVPTTERLDPGSPTEPLPGVDQSTWHAGAWIEGELRPLAPLALVAGARVDRLPGETGATVDPRVGAAWSVDDWTLRAGAGIFRQGRWRARYRLPAGGDPSGVPRRARHWTVGAERRGRPQVRADAYVKEYEGYVADGDDGPAIENGRTRGLDVLARWPDDGRLGGWLAYSLLHGRVELADGRTVSSDYDVTHSVTAVGTLRWGAWQLGTTVRYATGRPYTPVLGGRRDADGFLGPVHGAPNGERLPDYFRLDGRLTRFVPLGNGFLVTYVEMLNLTDRANASAIVYDANWEDPRPVDSFFADRTFVAGFEFRP